MIINPVIYAEFSLAFESVEATDGTIEALELRVYEPSRSALFLAGRASLRYRREGGSKANVLADFLIGAHAAILRCEILTRDARRYRSHFPRVELVTPD